MTPSPRQGGFSAGRGLRWAVTLLLTGGVLAALLRWLGGGHAVLGALRHVTPSALVEALGFSALAVVVGVVRWQAVLSMMGFRLPFRQGLRATLEVWPLVVVAPSRANELLRAAAIRDRVPFWAGAGSVLAEKVVDLNTLLVLAAVGTAIEQLWSGTALILGGIAALWLGVVVAWLAGARLLRWRPLRRFEQKAEQLGVAFRAMATHPLQVLWISVLSIVVRLLVIGVLVALLNGLGAGVEPVTTLALAPAALVVGLLPFTMTGIGMRDAAFLWLVRHSGHAVPNPGAVIAATLGYSLISTWAIAALSLPLMVRAGIRLQRAKEDHATGGRSASEAAVAGQPGGIRAKI